MERAQAEFRAAGTQVLGVSIDSLYSHMQWARSLGGVSFPLLQDFEPKGALAKALGVYLDGPGITDRATVMIDKEGIVRKRKLGYSPTMLNNTVKLVQELEQESR